MSNPRRKLTFSLDDVTRLLLAQCAEREGRSIENCAYRLLVRAVREAAAQAAHGLPLEPHTNVDVSGK
jgi:hypothetical protein